LRLPQEMASELVVVTDKKVPLKKRVTKGGASASPRMVLIQRGGAHE
jgi:hypothetical protein